MSAHPEPTVTGWCVYVRSGGGFALMGARHLRPEHVLARLAEDWWTCSGSIPVRIVRANVVPA